VAEVGTTAEDDQLYRLSYDGTIVDEPEYLVMGGQADALTAETKRTYRAGLPLDDAIRVAVGALSSVGGVDGKPRVLPAGQLEVAVLDRNRGKRKFRRITGAALTQAVPETQGEAAEPAPTDTPRHDADQASDGGSETSS
jgi:proteasome alpha subunit